MTNFGVSSLCMKLHRLPHNGTLFFGIYAEYNVDVMCVFWIWWALEMFCGGWTMPRLVVSEKACLRHCTWMEWASLRPLLHLGAIRCAVGVACVSWDWETRGKNVSAGGLAKRFDQFTGQTISRPPARTIICDVNMGRDTDLASCPGHFFFRAVIFLLYNNIRTSLYLSLTYYL